MDYGHGIPDVSTYSNTLRMKITKYLAGVDDVRNHLESLLASDSAGASQRR